MAKKKNTSRDKDAKLGKTLMKIMAKIKAESESETETGEE